MVITVTRPRLEVADILRAHTAEYRDTHPVSSEQSAVIRHLTSCRTAALGGHVDVCDSCGHQRNSYNSCRDRHCPKCQSLKKAEWLEQRCNRLLPVPHFHVVFTLPDSLRPLVLRNKRLLYNLLFATAADTLTTITRDEQHLGAQVGFTTVLHTWTQELRFHPHVHCVVTGGGLSADGKRWVESSPNFLVSVRVLAKYFRGRFLEALQKLYVGGHLDLDGSTADLADPETWNVFRDDLYHTRWVVYAKPPFGGPEHVFQYLGRYTHRVAISNHRLIELDEGMVSFTYRDSRNKGQSKTQSIPAVEFVRRFLLHVLPKRFVRIRHYGLLAGRNVLTRLDQARRLLTAHAPADAARHPQPSTPTETVMSWWARLLALTGVDLFACPTCKIGRLLPSRLILPSSLVAIDSS